jgi:hypothetical protein
MTATKPRETIADIAERAKTDVNEAAKLYEITTQGYSLSDAFLAGHKYSIKAATTKIHAEYKAKIEVMENSYLDQLEAEASALVAKDEELERLRNQLETHNEYQKSGPTALLASYEENARLRELLKGAEESMVAVAMKCEDRGSQRFIMGEVEVLRKALSGGEV